MAEPTKGTPATIKVVPAVIKAKAGKVSVGEVKGGKEEE